MEEEILEKKPSNPVESALLIISCLCLIFSIGLSRIEVVEYLKETPESEFATDAKDRILDKYKNDSKINNIKSSLDKEKKKINDFIFDPSAGSGSASN